MTVGISAKEAQSEQLAGFIQTLKEQNDAITEFDEALWGSMSDFVTVCRDKNITVTFKDRTETQA